LATYCKSVLLPSVIIHLAVNKLLKNLEPPEEISHEAQEVQVPRRLRIQHAVMQSRSAKKNRDISQGTQK
jgi:hypothetical protein